MAEKVKKKPAFLNFIQRSSAKGKDEPNSPVPMPNNSSTTFRLPNPANGTWTSRVPNGSGHEMKPRKLSAGGLKELVQCSLCLEVLHNPKMLPCQHTFCMACLTVYIADLPVFECPICNTRIQVISPNFVDQLPSNLYIDHLLLMVGMKTEDPRASVTPSAPAPSSMPAVGVTSVDLFAGGVRCSHCQTMCDNLDVTACDHCKMNFCRVCWSQHLDDMRTQIGSILKQLESAAGRLGHKIEHHKDRCERIVEQINITAEEKINDIMETKGCLLQEASELQKNGDMTGLALKNSLEEARVVATKAMTIKDFTNDKDQVSTFMNLHQNALQLLSDVSKWNEASFVFDRENFRIEHDTDTPVDAESDAPLPDGAKQNNPLESEESLVMHYRSRHFVPHYVWRKTARPGGVSISPFNDHLYVCGTDSHSVNVVERSQAKIVARITCPEMLCPLNIAFLKSLGEIYVTDKWKHCIHVFSKDGEYIRSLGQKGSRPGMFRSPEGIATDNATNLIYVVDTGNDRVQVIQADGKVVDQIGVGVKMQSFQTARVWEMKDTNCTELNAPTSVALTKDRVIVLDSGNRRVKVYNKLDKSKILEFGATGQRKGQFRQPEVLAVDPMGFILVGDSGNCRIQVFKPNGQLVRVFGGFGSEMGKFGWISGIHVTKQLDIIVSDSKNHVVNFF